MEARNDTPAPQIPEGAVITAETLVELIGSAPEMWPQWQKRVPTHAIRMSGPFRVETSETENEPFYCEDGWLAVDARGYPYAIADEEFQLIYQPHADVPAGAQAS